MQDGSSYAERHRKSTLRMGQWTPEEQAYTVKRDGGVAKLAPESIIGCVVPVPTESETECVDPVPTEPAQKCSC